MGRAIDEDIDRVLSKRPKKSSLSLDSLLPLLSGDCGVKSAGDGLLLRAHPKGNKCSLRPARADSGVETRLNSLGRDLGGGIRIGAGLAKLADINGVEDKIAS